MTKASRSTRPPKLVAKRIPVDLREIYEDGKRILEKLSKRAVGKSRHSVIRSLAKDTQLNSAELWKRVAFAKTYNEMQLTELLKLENLAWSHVRKLLTLENVKQRDRFAVDANGHGWSPHFMVCEIEARLGVKNFGGRPTKSLPLTPGTLYELSRKAERMLHLLEAFGRGDDDSRSVRKNDLAKCQKLLDGVVAKLDELKKALPGFKKRLEQMLQLPQNHGEPASSVAQRFFNCFFASVAASDFAYR